MSAPPRLDEPRRDPGRQSFWLEEDGALREVRADALLEAFENGEVTADASVRILPDAPPRPLRRYLTELVWTAHQLRTRAEVREGDASLFEAAFERAPIGMVLSDLVGRIRHANAAFCAMIGYAHAELCELRVGQISDAHDRDREVALGNQLLAGQLESFQLDKRFRTKAGALIDTVTSIALVRHADGSPGWVLAHVQDTTPLRALEFGIAERTAALAHSEERFARLFRHGPQATLIVDAARRIVQANEGALALFGYAEAELRGQPISALVPAEVRAHHDALMRGFDPSAGGRAMAPGRTVRAQRRDGTVFDAEITLVALDAPGEPQVLVGLTDVSARLAAEEGTRRSLQEKATLLKEIHHRVKNNLQIISSLLALQSERVESAEVRAQLFESVHRVRSMALLHEQIYGVESLARIELKRYVATLGTYLCGALAPDAALEVVGDEVDVGIDQAVPLAMILNELVTNALKYGRRPAAHAGPAPARRLPPDRDVLVEVVRDGDGVQLAVTDAGAGPPPDLLGAPPTTLGLQLVRSLGRQLRARLSVDGGGGARITLRVPLGAGA